MSDGKILESIFHLRQNLICAINVIIHNFYQTELWSEVWLMSFFEEWNIYLANVMSSLSFLQ